VVVAPSHRIGASLDPAVVSALREIFAREGMHESWSAEREGIFIILESHEEVSLQYNLPEPESFSSNAASYRKAKDQLVRCCSILAERGFLVTLIVSPRTLALFVRSAPKPDATK